MVERWLYADVMQRGRTAFGKFRYLPLIYATDVRTVDSHNLGGNWQYFVSHITRNGGTTSFGDFKDAYEAAFEAQKDGRTAFSWTASSYAARFWRSYLPKNHPCYWALGLPRNQQFSYVLSESQPHEEGDVDKDYIKTPPGYKPINKPTRPAQKKAMTPEEKFQYRIKRMFEQERKRLETA